MGPADAGLVLDTEWSGPAPALDADLRVARRAGCDVAPIDLEDAEARLRLESFIWGDQPERLARLRGAIAMTRRAGVAIDEARAGDWLERKLEANEPGLARVVFHSVVWWYLPVEEQQRVTATIEAAGARADASSPLAWLRMEGQDLDHAEVRLRLWPGGDDLLLGRTRYHGQAVEWLPRSAPVAMAS
jgi:hypothetical protein